jgi:hypothetical protein
MMDISKGELKYIYESHGANVVDLTELFAEGMLSLDDLGFLIEDETL